MKKFVCCLMTLGMFLGMCIFTHPACTKAEDVVIFHSKDLTEEVYEEEVKEVLKRCARSKLYFTEIPGVIEKVDNKIKLVRIFENLERIASGDLDSKNYVEIVKVYLPHISEYREIYVYIFYIQEYLTNV